jgi:hypothetical protein
MIRPFVLVIWIALMVATALTLQVLANWVLSAGLALYILLRWRSRRRGIPLPLRQHDSAADLWPWRAYGRRGQISLPRLKTDRSVVKCASANG